MLFNLYKVKYKILENLIRQNITNLNPGSNVNIFINLETILVKIANSNIDDYMKVKKNERILELISSIINVAAHYRLFFSKNKLYTRVYLYMNNPSTNVRYKNNVLEKNYRNSYKYAFNKPNSIFKNVLNDSMDLLKVIVEYIDGVYVIDTNEIESSLIPAIIDKHADTNSNINLIISNDRYDYQYCIDNDRYYILRAKQDDSYIVSQKNVMQNIKLEDKVVNDINIDNSFIPFMLSVLGDKKRNIDKIKGVRTTSLLKMINKGIDEQIISPSDNNINVMVNLIKEDYKDKVLNNFFLTDINHQLVTLNTRDIDSVLNKLKDKYDLKSLKQMNDKYFTYYPLYLMEICDAIKYKK